MNPPPPIRIALVGPSLRVFGGQAVQASRLVEGWSADPHVRAWLVPSDPMPPPPLNRLMGVKIVRTLLGQLCYWPLLLRELRKADVVHVFSASYFSFLAGTIPPIVISKLLGKPVVVNYRSGEAPDHLKRSPLARAALRSVDANVVPSTFLRDVFGNFAIDARVVSNTIDLTRFAYRVRDPLRPRLLSTRNFEALYNVACTLRAFARVQAQFPDASLTVIGVGPQEAMLRRLADELKLANVSFVGRVQPSEIAKYYADADIYIQTPSIDNMPGSVLEAFASGAVVVATNVGGVPAILTDGVHGLLAPENDDAAIADRVIQLLRQPDEARRLAAAARATCESYRWPVVRNDWLSVYRSLADPPLAARAADTDQP